MEAKRNKKAKISSDLKYSVWVTYIGEHYKAVCSACNITQIDPFHFECGHVHAEALGGETTLGNLRPICPKCNRSMGTMHMVDFMRAHGYKIGRQLHTHKLPDLVLITIKQTDYQPKYIIDMPDTPTCYVETGSIIKSIAERKTGFYQDIIALLWLDHNYPTHHSIRRNNTTNHSDTKTFLIHRDGRFVAHTIDEVIDAIHTFIIGSTDINNKLIEATKALRAKNISIAPNINIKTEIRAMLRYFT